MQNAHWDPQNYVLYCYHIDLPIPIREIKLCAKYTPTRTKLHPWHIDYPFFHIREILAYKPCTLTRRILHAVSLSYGLLFVPYPQNKTTYTWHAKHTHWTLYAVSLSYRLPFVSYPQNKTTYTGMQSIHSEHYTLYLCHIDYPLFHILEKRKTTNAKHTHWHAKQYMLCPCHINNLLFY